MRIGFFVGLAWVFAVSAGCGGRSSNEYAQLLDAEDDAVAAECDCFELAGFASHSECVELNAHFYYQADSEEERECGIDAWDEHADAAAIQEIQCPIDFNRELASCYRGNTACDPDIAQACYDAAFEQYSNVCNEITGPVVAALRMCSDL